MSKGDPSIFYYHENNELKGLTAILVDDFLWSDTSDFETSYISKLQNTFTVGRENHSVFQYLGLHLNEQDSEITIDQINYSDNLKSITLSNNAEINTKDLLQSQIGKLLWISGQILHLMFSS